MLADLRFLHVPSSDTNVLPTFLLQVGQGKYLFNVGEGTSRSSTQRKAGLARVSNIFVPRVGWEAIGGLPGTLMSMSDGQRSEETVHGPSGLRYALATMRTYAKRDIMKLTIREIDSAVSNPNSPTFQDANLAVHAITLSPLRTSSRVTKKPKLDSPSQKVELSTLARVDQMWRKSNFDPTSLHGDEARAWIQLVADCMFNDNLRRQGVDVAADIEVETHQSIPRPNGNYQWKPPLSPAFVSRQLPPPVSDERVHTNDRLNPAEGGQAAVLAFICEGHPQRGKFDPVKASDAGVAPGRDFATLTQGQDIKVHRPKTWQTMLSDDRKAWLQQNRKPRQHGNTQPQSVDIKTPANASNTQLEEVTVKSADVVGPSRAGPVFFSIYLPSADYIDDLVGGEAATVSFAPYTSESNKDKPKGQSRVPQVIVHAAPTNVLEDDRYQTWMLQFGPDCHHIFANRDVCCNKLMFPSSATIPLRLSKLDPIMFHVPQYQLKPRIDPQSVLVAAPAKLKVVAAHADMLVQLQPRADPKKFQSDAPDFDWPANSRQAENLASFSSEPVGGPLHPSSTSEAAKPPKTVTNKELGTDKSVRLLQARKQAWSNYLDHIQQVNSTTLGNGSASSVVPKDDVLVTTLGTGSASPSKYRNVISTLIQTPNSGNILLDAGESTYGLLHRKFGCHRDGTATQVNSLKGEDVDQILTNLRVLFISHIHADHHIGLIRLLTERRKLLPRPEHPLYLVATSFVKTYLQEYSSIERLGLDEDVVVLVNEHLDWKTGVDPLNKSLGTEVAGEGYSNVRGEHLRHVEAIKALTGLDHVHTAKVNHRGSHCYGLVLKHSQGWSVTYSGDTRPAPELIDAGQNTTLLIHEATLEDSQLDMAIGKGHSTFGEAIRVGKQMNAQNILLTHFSQRYAKMAKSSLFAASAASTPIALAFDMVTYPLSQFAKIQRYTPAMEALFAADMEGDEEGSDDAGRSLSQDAHVKQAAKAGLALKSTGPDKNPDAYSASKADLSWAPSTAVFDKQARQPTRVRKAMKPTEWRYLGINLSLPPYSSNASTSVMTPTVLQAAELIRSAQTSVMGVVGGSVPFDVLALYRSNDETKMAWNVVVRTLPSHAPDLAAALALLPTPTLPFRERQSSGLKVRLSIVGPFTSIQTAQSLLI